MMGYSVFTLNHRDPSIFGPPAHKNALRAYTTGEAPDQFASGNLCY